ncbi:MAG: MFS transporter [archaeon]|nr:MFS transporter [archaeon]
MLTLSLATTTAPDYRHFRDEGEAIEADVDDANIAEDEDVLLDTLEEDPLERDFANSLPAEERLTNRFTQRATGAGEGGGETGRGEGKDVVEYNTNLPWRIRLGYSLGEMGIVSANQLLSFFKNVFLLDVALLPASVVAIVLLLSTLWDAFTDILFGALSDKTVSVFGRRRPYLLLGAVAYAGFFYAFFQSPIVPTSAEDRLISREAYYFMCYFLFKTAGTVYSIPYYSLVAELTSSYNERTKLTSLRTVFSSVTNLAMLPLWSWIVSSFPSEEDPSQPNLQLGYSVAAALIIPLTVLPSIVTFTQIKEPSIPPPPKKPRPWRTMVAPVFRNRTFLFTLAIFLSANLASQFVINNLVLFVKYILQADKSLSIMMILLQGFTILSLAIWTPLASRLGKSWTFMISAVFFVVPLSLTWLFDENTNIAWVYIAFSISGIGVGGLMLLPWSMMGDCVDVDELTTGIRREGLYFGLFVLFQKIALAGALAGANYALDGAGYINHPPGSDDPYFQPSEVVLALRVMVGPVSTGLAVLSFIPAFFYPLNRHQHAKLNEQLKEQRRFRAATKRSTTLTARNTHQPSGPTTDLNDPFFDHHPAESRLDLTFETDPLVGSFS